MPNNDIKLQVKSSGQYLNIYGLGNENGINACQGLLPTTKNFSWTMSDAPGNPGWSLLQVKSSNKYLCIAGSSLENGATAVQQDLPSPITDNFLWKKTAISGDTVWSLFQVKHSLQYLNILGGGDLNGQTACQGNTPTTDNFFWLQQPDNPKNIKIDLNILDCNGMYSQQPGLVADSIDNQYLQFGDDNNGHKENGNQSSFESLVNPGSLITWKAKSTDNADYKFSIASITYEPASSVKNIFNAGTEPGDGNKDGGQVSAQVLWTAIPVESGDNESYTITFTLTPKNGPNKDQTKTFWVDPKLKVDPGTATDK